MKVAIGIGDEDWSHKGWGVFLPYFEYTILKYDLNYSMITIKKSISIIVLAILVLFMACDSDNTAPELVITSPIHGSAVQGTVLIQVTASDAILVAKVEFFIDGVLKYTAKTYPREYSWEARNYADGNQHSIFVKGYDPSGNVGYSQNVIVTVPLPEEKVVHKHTVKPEEKIREETSSISSQITKNQAPTAMFTIDPDSGSTKTIFIFDASKSSDLEDDDSQLQVRWDWENDGKWDTDFNASMIVANQFTRAGRYSIIMEVKDTDGLTDKMIKNIIIEQIKETKVSSYNYKTIQIGDQVWMAENLRETNYRDGSPIPEIKSNGEWSNTSAGAYSTYENDKNNIETYGILYNWYAVSDGRELAPKGWHVPSASEWQVLTNYLGGDKIAGGSLKEKGVDHWVRPNTGANNSSYFAALPAGYRGFVDGNYSSMGYGSYFWSATELGETYAYFCELHYRNSEIQRFSFDKNYGLSVRCLKD